MNFNQKETTKRITILTTAITLSSIIALSPILDNQNAFAASYDVKIINELEEDLIFKEVKNRQNIKIKSSPPDEVKSGKTGEFKIADGSNLKPKHLNVKYYVGDKGSEKTVTIGVKPADTANNDFKCFQKSPDDIKGSVVCGSKTLKYTFSPK